MGLIFEAVLYPVAGGHESRLADRRCRLYPKGMTMQRTLRKIDRSCWILLLLCWWGATARLVAEEPAVAEAKKPEVTLDAGTQADAEAALAVAGQFLKLWEDKKYEEAGKLALEPIREGFDKEMRKSPIKLQRIEKILLRKSRSGEGLAARVHFLQDPPPTRKDLKSVTQALDMVLHEGKWVLTAR